MVLCSPTTRASCSTYYGSSLISPAVWWSRCPINRILQRCSDRVIIIRRGKEDAVGLKDLNPESFNL
uniref:NADPH:QUINONE OXIDOREDUCTASE family protein n=1 Tax=Rhizophora mucronata TaxID=61149 RepID=A0A2P2MIM4_RHIMU